MYIYDQTPDINDLGAIFHNPFATVVAYRLI